MPISAAAIRVDITPELHLPPTGFSLQHKHACWEARGRLFATCLLIDDTAGHRVALIGVDLHVATRPVLDALIAALPAGFGLAPEAVVFSASHTHSAPGGFYGYPYFDMLAARTPGRNPGFVAWLGERIGRAVATLPAHLRPARVGYGRAADPGLTRNRSMVSFKRNVRGGTAVDIDTFAKEIGHPGVGKVLPKDQLAVDPFVHALWLEGEDGAPIGGFCTLAGHNTVAGPTHRWMTGDAFGVAVRHAQERMHTAWGARAPVALVSGSSGDTQFVHGDEKGLALEGEAAWAEVLSVGARAGEVLWRALEAARGAALPAGGVQITCRDLDLPDAACVAADRRGNPPPRRLAAHGLPGDGVPKGGPFNPSWPGLPPGPSLPPDHPQWPKTGVVLGAPVGAMMPAPTRFPLRVLRVGHVQVVGLPGEPTTMLTQRVRDELPPGPSLVCGYSGSYVGYLTTPEEYEHQDYEGASTLWGRWTGDWVVEQVALAAKGHATPYGPAGYGDTLLKVGAPKRMNALAKAEPTRLEVKRVADGWRVRGSWSPKDRALLPLSGPAAELHAPAAIILQVRNAAGAWSALSWRGQPVDDRSQLFLLWVDLAPARYAFEYVLPAAAAHAGQVVRFEVGLPSLRPAGAYSEAVTLP